MTTSLKILGLAWGLVLVAGPAESAIRSFSIPPFSVTADLNTAALISGAIGIPEETFRIYVNFTLPADYATNTAVKLRLYFSTPNAPCGMSFGATLMERSRPGSVHSVKVSPASDIGLLRGTISTLLFDQSDKTFVRSMTIQAPASGSILSQKPGDGIKLALVRVATDSGDTCPGPVELHHVEVVYNTP